MEIVVTYSLSVAPYPGVRIIGWHLEPAYVVVESRAVETEHGSERGKWRNLSVPPKPNGIAAPAPSRVAPVAAGWPTSDAATRTKIADPFD